MFDFDNPLDAMYFDWYVHPEYNHGDNAAFYQHMPTLRHMCHDKGVLELGSRYGTSTLAILAARPSYLYSVDIERRATITTLELLAQDEKIPFNFYEMDDLNFCGKMVEHPHLYPEFQIVFIDTLHTYNQLRAELFAFGPMATEYIVLHDIVSFGRKNEDGNMNGSQGLIPAIEEFLAAHSEWVIDSFYFNCNGLMILRRI